MKVDMRIFILSLCIAAVLASGAQARSVFQSKPAIENGYDALVKAGDLAKKSQTLEKAIQPGATLTIKRATRRDPAIRRALELAREGLAKPCHLPERGPGVRSPSG